MTQTKIGHRFLLVRIVIVHVWQEAHTPASNARKAIIEQLKGKVIEILDESAGRLLSISRACAKITIAM